MSGPFEGLDWAFAWPERPESRSGPPATYGQMGQVGVPMCSILVGSAAALPIMKLHQSGVLRDAVNSKINMKDGHMPGEVVFLRERAAFVLEHLQGLGRQFV